MVLSARNLGLTLGGEQKTVLRDVSLELERRETALLEGASGAGKTALGIALCGLLPQWAGVYDLEGSVRLLDRDVEQGMWNPEVGIVLENPWTQLSGLKSTVGEELAFPLECRGTNRVSIPEIVGRYAGMFGVGDLLDRRVHTLSGGELQRVLAAGALISEPRFLFLDRPLTEIDSGFRPRFLEVIRRHVGALEGAALLAEDPWLVPGERFDRIFRLDAGSLRGSGPGAVKTEPGGPEPGSGRSAPAGGLLRVENLTFGYDPAHPVLEGLSFSIGRGDIAFITGPNGAGKSTLGRLLSGILRPWSGDIFLEGVSYRNLRQRDIMSRVGFALQNAGLHFARSTVREELELAEKWGHPPGGLTAILELDRVLETHPFELTQGGRKRLALALATGENRWAAVLDEPTQYQDAEGFRMTTGAIRRLADDGVAVLLISHDPRLYREFPEAGEIRLS